MRKLLDRFNEKWKENDNGCWIWTAGKYANGYGTIRIGSKADGTAKSVGAHRLSYELHIGPIAGGLHVLHKCDVRGCVNPEHLFLGTNQDNILDSMSKNRRKGVTRNRPSGLTYTKDRKPRKLKLSEAQIDEIITRVRNGEAQAKLAKEFGIHQSTISKWINHGIRLSSQI